MEAARRKIAALQLVIVSERRSRESNDLYPAKPSDTPPPPPAIPFLAWVSSHPAPARPLCPLR